MDNTEEENQIVCADCGALEPEWASINRGVLICSECCSVHRNLGRYISQIRSLKKGSWHANQLSLVKLLYKNGANNIWEHSLIDVNNGLYKSKKKPVSNDPIVPKKETFIKAKYVQLNYAIRPSKEKNLTLGDLNKQLWCCVRTSYVETTLRLLALGADPNYIDPDTGNSPLHIAAKENQKLQIELLWIYGGDVSQKNLEKKTAADVARNENNLEIASRLEELEFEVTDRFSMFLCGRISEHSDNQHFLIPELTGPTNNEIKQYRLLLQNTSFNILERLIQDVYDEIDRREVSMQWHAAERYRISNHQHIAVFLPPIQQLSATRNQLRQKLAKFDAQDFSQLIIDLLKEIRRRYYGLPLPPEVEQNSLTMSKSYLPLSNKLDNDENKDYDEVPDVSLNVQKAISKNNKNQIIALDNYLELKENINETSEKLENFLKTNYQLLKSMKNMESAIEHLQTEQIKIFNFINALSFDNQNKKQTFSPTNFQKSINLTLLKNTVSEIGVLSNTSEIENSKKKSNTSLDFDHLYQPNNLTSPILLSKSAVTFTNYHPAQSSNSALLNNTFNDKKFKQNFDVFNNTEMSKQEPASIKFVKQTNFSGFNLNNEYDYQKNFDDNLDEVFLDNLILETELLTGAIKSLLADLQQKNNSHDANTVFHADSISHHIARIARIIPLQYMVGAIQNCVIEMEIAMKELLKKCLTRPLNTDETCHAAYDVAKAAKQLLVTVHSQNDI